MRVLSKSPLGGSAKLPSLKMWWWKVLLLLLLQRFLHKKKIGSRILRERRAWTLFQQPKSRAMGLDLGSKWAKLQKKKKRGSRKFLNTTLQHDISTTHPWQNDQKCSAGFILIGIYTYITKNKINWLNLFLEKEEE